VTAAHLVVVRLHAYPVKENSPKQYAERLALYDKLVATNAAVERKGATIPYTALNGHMFSYLAKSGKLALRLPADELQGFLKKYKTSLCQEYGVVQKEYAMVPDKLLQKTQELRKYFDLSYAYVDSLKPKGSKKGKA
jgi:hypothetical protein